MERRTDLGLDIVNGVGGLDLKGDGLARQGLHEAGGPKVSIFCGRDASARSAGARFGWLCSFADLVELTSALYGGKQSQRVTLLEFIIISEHAI